MISMILFHLSNITTVSTDLLPNPKQKQHDLLVALFAALVCFCTYSIVYAFRKPFTVGTFSGITLWGIDYKVVLVIFQLIGYTSSKFYGIKFISEMQRFGRWKIVLLLVGFSWLALFFFAIVPTPYNVVFLFFNGFPLGILWGIIFSYIEGRKATDFIGAALAVSFIFASGFVKSVAKYLQLQYAVTEFWLPFITGAFFILPLLLFVFLMEKIPPPSQNDIQLRNERKPMTKLERKNLFFQFMPGLIVLIILYVFLTLFRDIRDNFAADMWNELGYSNKASVFTQTETPIAVILLIVIASLVFIKNNFKAFVAAHCLIAVGFITTGFTTYLFMQHSINGFYWMLTVGLGLYLAYIPFNCLLFERMVAAFRWKANVGFLMYLSDSFGYLASILVLFGKEIFSLKLNWVNFYTKGVVVFSLLGLLGTFISAFYFYTKYKKTNHLWKSAQQL